MTQREETALFIYQHSRHLPRELRERLLDNFLAASGADRISLEQFSEHQLAMGQLNEHTLHRVGGV